MLQKNYILNKCCSFKLVVHNYVPVAPNAKFPLEDLKPDLSRIYIKLQASRQVGLWSWANQCVISARQSLCVNYSTTHQRGSLMPRRRHTNIEHAK